MAKSKRSRPQRDISVTHPNAAAIDIGARMHVAAVRPDRDAEPVRSFGTFTGDLHRLADWFEHCGVLTVAMESTGVYWIPVFEILDQRGFEVILVNARDAKHVPGRKTDVSDAQWLHGCTNTACSGPASSPKDRSQRCVPTCASVSGCWSILPPTSSTCRRR